MVRLAGLTLVDDCPLGVFHAHFDFLLCLCRWSSWVIAALVLLCSCKTQSISIHIVPIEIWLPQLSWYAQHGFKKKIEILSRSYSVSPVSLWPLRLQFFSAIFSCSFAWPLNALHLEFVWFALNIWHGSSVSFHFCFFTQAASKKKQLAFSNR